MQDVLTVMAVYLFLVISAIILMAAWFTSESETKFWPMSIGGFFVLLAFNVLAAVLWDASRIVMLFSAGLVTFWAIMSFWVPPAAERIEERLEKNRIEREAKREEERVAEAARTERIVIFPADIRGDFMLVGADDTTTNLGNIMQFDRSQTEGLEYFRCSHSIGSGAYKVSEIYLTIRPPDHLLRSPFVDFWEEVIDPDRTPDSTWMYLRIFCAVLVWRHSPEKETLKIALHPDLSEAEQLILAAMFHETDGLEISVFHDGRLGGHGEEVPISFSEIL